MRQILWALLVPFLCAVAACSDSPARPEMSPTLTPNTQTPTERVVATLGEPIQARLKNFPWLLDESQASKEFADALGGAEFAAQLADRGKRQADLLAFFDAIDEAKWPGAAPNAEDKLFLVALLRMYTVGKSGAMSGNLFNETGLWGPDYPWRDVIIDSIEKNLHQVHRSAGGETVHLVAWGEDLVKAAEALGYASQNVGEVERLVSGLKAPYILILVESVEGADYCGQAFARVHVILINGSMCSLEETVTHELVHFASPLSGFVPWFEEGLPELLSLYIADVDLPMAIEEQPGGLGEAHFFWLDYWNQPVGLRMTPEEMIQERSAGSLFLYQVAQIIGYEAFAGMVTRLEAPDFRGQDVLDAILEVTAPELRTEIIDLIAKWCRVSEYDPLTRQELASPCEAT